MKIEKVNENQIRCTLTREDLADRELKISELAYGTEKAKNLFRDMMQQASFECGFEAEDIPLMIEAIPLNADCIVLIITKVEDPEELDTRFAKFAPSVHDEETDEETVQDALEDTDDVLDLFKKLHASRKAAGDKLSQAAEFVKKEKDAEKPVEVSELARIFVFESLHDIIKIAGVVGNHFVGNNSLYKDESENVYLLMVKGSSDDPHEFNCVCNILSEYGIPKKCMPASLSYLSEHYTCVIPYGALQKLAQLS
ncbi:MAG: adaptor protein MecA [Lachnospiraceae bacterium]